MATGRSAGRFISRRSFHACLMMLNGTMDEERTDENDAEALVKEINQIPLEDINQLVALLNPSMTLTSKDGYVFVGVC